MKIKIVFFIAMLFIISCRNSSTEGILADQTSYIYVFSGQSQVASASRLFRSYNVIEWEELPVNNLSFYAGAVTNHQGSIFYYGGCDTVTSCADSSDKILTPVRSQLLQDPTPLPTGLVGSMALFYDNKTYLVGGAMQGGAVLTGGIYESANGTSFSYVGNFPTNIYFAGSVVFANKMFIIGGNTGSSRTLFSDKVYSSVDGLNWTHSGTLPTTYSGVSAASFNNQIWIAGGFVNGNSNLRTANVYSSSDGVSWALRSQLPISLADGSLLVFKNKLYYVGGTVNSATDFTSIDQSAIYESNDGLSWAFGASLPLGARFGAVVSGL